MTLALSPDSDDDTRDHDTPTNFHVVPCNPNLGFDLEAQQGEGNRLSASKPLHSKELCQIFFGVQKTCTRACGERQTVCLTGQK